MSIFLTVISKKHETHKVGNEQKDMYSELSSNRKRWCITDYHYNQDWDITNIKDLKRITRKLLKEEMEHNGASIATRRRTQVSS